MANSIAITNIGGGGGSTIEVEIRMVTAGEEAAKSITLGDTPADPSKVIMLVADAANLFYSVDFSVSGNTVIWTGLGLDGLLLENDKVTILYTI